jgi:hypothetical protein
MTQRFAVVGGKMTRPLGFVLALFIVGSYSPAKAGGNTNVKCAPNEDRVWVYESLDDFNVAAKLKCGDPVQIVGRVKGYVKIETANGTDGYVLDSALPKSALPPEPEEKPNTVEAASLAFAARRAAKSSASSASPAPSTSSASAVASSAPVAVASKPVPAAQPAIAPAQPQPEVAMAASASAPPASSSSQPAHTPPVALAVTTAPAPAASSAPVTNTASTQPTPSQPAPAAPKAVAKYSNPQPVSPSRPKKTKSAPLAPADASISAPPPTVAAVATSTPPPPAPVSMAPKPAAQPAPSAASRVEVDASSADTETSASLQPVSTPSAHAVTPAVKPPVNPDDEEDASVKPLDDDTAGCTHYFSAYGLSPNQYKWIAQNRHKAFPSVCPAPTPSMVDFVVIFTHDVAFYNVTMPNAIHVEKNGFSDWTPLTTVDTALMNASDANKSHHEYVWVFHTNRGAFDPAKFSSRRRPLYSKSETNTLGSRGGFRTVMDALTFIESNGTNP